MGSHYDRCRAGVQQVEAAYDELLQALDSYEAILKSLPRDDEKLVIALDMQVKGVTRLKDLLESEVLDRMIRFSDRVIRIKHWEDGTFV